tara:strand:+ start:1207 stop:1365 length:159 start_codon:yes stop_codon:yes gene_type:complete
MKEYEKIKKEQAEHLGSIDNVHPMKQVTVMSAVQVIMLIGMGLMMILIGNSI